MEDIRKATATMRSTADEMLALVDAMPEASIAWRPAPDVWSVLENLCHVAEFVPYWTAQIAQVIRAPQQQWGRTHHDPDRLAAVAAASSRSLEDVKLAIHSAVLDSASTLNAYTPQQLATEAPSCNPRWGVKPASFIVDTLLVNHLASHLGQIRRNLAQFQEQENNLDTAV
jgi:uncharacterized damage-inducible protein DinB